MGSPAPTRILAIRHGETDWNVDSRIQGHIDIPLNATGRRQVARLTDAVRNDGLACVYSSDLGRAVETAAAVLRGAGLDALRLDSGLRERNFGAFEGRTPAEIEAAWPDEHARWRARDPSFGASRGETLQVFHDRCVAVATRLAQAHPGQTIALVAHGGVLDCLYRAATRTPLEAPRTWLLGNAAINRVLFSGDGFQMMGWGDSRHLEGMGSDMHGGTSIQAAPEPADLEAPQLMR